MNINQSNEVNERLRFCRALNIFSRALTFYVIGKKEVNEKNLFSALVNLYFSIFHISIASLLLLQDFPFEKKKFYLLLDEKISPEKKRLGVTHKEVLKKLEERKEKFRFINKLYEEYRDAKDLRELASYGPYVKLYAAEGIPYEGILSREWIFIHTSPIALKKLEDISGSKPRKFDPVRKIMD
jgi:uncharacterized protein (UPF0332 family)